MSKSLKNISVVASATMASRVLGQVRETLIATVFGASALSSAFVTAFQLPNLFRRLLGEGALTAAFVPTLNEELEKRQREGAFRLVNQVGSWLLVTTGILVGLAMLAFSQPGWLTWLGVRAGAEDDTIRRWLMGADLTVILFPYLIFVCLAAVFSGALQTFDRFLEPAISPIWLNVLMIAALVTGTKIYAGNGDAQLRLLCAGVLVGGFLQMAVPAWALMREGWRPRLDLAKSEAVRAIARLMLPTVFGSAVYLINMTVSRFIGLSLNDAAVSLLNYAQRLMELPIGVFAVAVSTVVFPLISRYAVQGDYSRMGDAYRQGMRLILMINIPAACGLGVLAEPVIRMLFQYGKFAANDTVSMMPVLVVYALGLPFFSFVNLILRAFYAQKDTKTPVQGALLSFAVNLVLSFALMGRFSTVGLAIAGNVAIVVQAWYLHVRLARTRPELSLKSLGSDLLKIIFASAAMGGAVWVGWHAWKQYLLSSRVGDAVIDTLYITVKATARDVVSRAIGDAVGIAMMIVLGVGLYAALVWTLRVKGREEITALIKRKLGRKPA